MRINKAGRTLALLLTLLLVISAFAGCNQDGTGSSQNDAGSSGSSTESAAESGAASQGDDGSQAASGDDAYNLVMAIIGNEQPNQDAVFEAVSALMQEEINMTFEPILLGFGDYQEKLNLMLSGGDRLDVLPVYFSQASSYINAGQIIDLSGYISDYGQGILDFMGEDVATSGSMNGFVYGIPANKESSSRAGIVMRKDIVDELGIDIESLKTPWDLTEVFAKVKQAHPELDCIAGTNILYKIETHDPLFDDFGVLMDHGQDTTVTNWYETEEYRERTSLVNEWYKAGYVKLDAATTTETNQNLVKAGSLFSYISSIKPGFLIQENASCGMEMVTQYLGDQNGNPAANLWTNSVNFFDWGIAQQAQDKVKAMEFLNYAYTSPEWNNLMNFGIEGTDHVKVEGSDVLIDYPEGADTAAVYHMNMGWMYPNQFIGSVWNGQPENIWEQYQDFNAEVTYSKAFGFMYDSSSVATELTALNSVAEEYVKSIETGSVSDLDATLKAFNEKLYAAGLQKVMDLKQEQLDAWLAKQ